PLITLQCPVAAFTDLHVSGTTCTSGGNEWDCKYQISYKVAATGQSYRNEPQSELSIVKSSGNIEYDARCGFDFQWSQRLRTSAYAVPGKEPQGWAGCKRTGDTVSNGIRGKNGLTFNVADADTKSLRLDLLPLAFRAQEMVKDEYGQGARATCDSVTENPDAKAVTCKVSGTRTVFQDNSLASVGLGMEVKGEFSDTVTIRPDGYKWALVKS
uniref:hypothetical protein n=1 Tax=Rhizobium fredii TaxID=380 RepID=UPI0005644559